MTEVLAKEVIEEGEEEEELEEGELSSEDEAEEKKPEEPKIKTPLLEKPIEKQAMEPEQQDDLETFMKKKMEEMQARVKSQLGPTARVSPDLGTASPDLRPPSTASADFPSTSSPGPFQGSSSPSGDKDYRAKDTDYRYLNRQPEPHSPNGYDRDYGDQDYRQDRRRPLMDHDDFYDQKRRRRHSPEPQGLLPPPPAAPSLPLLPDPDRQHPSSSRNGASQSSAGQRRGRLNKWGRPSICKFFREGYCRDGENCTYSHAAIDSCRKPELCKYYQQGFCKKTLVCPFLHGEWPCKAFNKGECSKGDDCAYSHARLDNFTQPVFDQMLKDEELASAIKIPQVATKRKTLLPVPLQPPGLPSNPNLEPVAPTGHTSRFDRVDHPNAVKAQTGFPDPLPTSSLSRPIPPPVPPFGAPPLGMALPPPGLVTIQATPVVSHSVGLLATPPGLSEPSILTSAPSLLPTPSMAPVEANMPNQIGEPPREDPSYNIHQMLAKIKASVGGNGLPDAPEEPEESPASPVAEAVVSRVPTISLMGQIQWHLVPCYIPCPPNQVAASLLDSSLTDAKLQNDPRIKKCLSKQFADTSKLISAGVPQPSPPQRPKDPRDRRAARDPRKKVVKTEEPMEVPQPNYEQMVEMQLKMTAALASETSLASYSSLPGPMLTSSPSVDLPPFNPPAHNNDVSSNAPGWMPSLSGVGSLGEGGEEADLTSLGLPVAPPIEASTRYNLPGVKVRKLKSES